MCANGMSHVSIPPQIRCAQYYRSLTANSRLILKPTALNSIRRPNLLIYARILRSAVIRTTQFPVRAMTLIKLFFASVVLILAVQTALAQSSDQSLPTPVLTNQISATIPALDLGDSRSTRHFYAFEATPGDLLVTINSRNLNGDVDIFTAVTFRPLTKITIYANTIPPEVTKSIYFRSNQVLILRVEARTPNDDPGVYRITFGGSFKPFSGGIPVAENQESSDTSATSDRNPNRLSSVGANVERPATSETPKAEATPERTSTESAKNPPANRRSTRRTPTRPGRRRTPPPKPAPTETAKQETQKEETVNTPPTETKPTVSESGAKSEEKPATEKPAAQEPTGPHLIIEQKDGTKIDRPMSSVRRVIVESGVIVIVLKTGRIERIRMADVVRMAIEP